tara:strand:- start:147 stop:323 length:177 start_codon:yes stop_codon:yes gene_type:complete
MDLMAPRKQRLEQEESEKAELRVREDPIDSRKQRLDQETADGKDADGKDAAAKIELNP